MSYWEKKGLAVGVLAAQAAAAACGHLYFSLSFSFPFSFVIINSLSWAIPLL